MNGTVTHVAGPTVPRASQTTSLPVRAWLLPNSEDGASSHLVARHWSAQRGVWAMTVCGRLYPQSVLTRPPLDGSRCAACTPTPAVRTAGAS